MASTYNLIASTTVGAGGASTFDFTSIPSTYTDLILYLSVRTNRNAYHESLLVKFNGAGTNWRYQRFYFPAGTADRNTTAMYAGQATGDQAQSNYFGVSRLEIFNYANTSFYKGSDSIGIAPNDSTTNYLAMNTSNQWNQTTTINQITITPENGGTIQQYSSAYLYGVKNS